MNKNFLGQSNLANQEATFLEQFHAPQNQSGLCWAIITELLLEYLLASDTNSRFE